MAHQQVPQDFALLELQQAYETIRYVFGLALQVTGVLVAADSVLLGYGFAQRQMGFVLIASTMPILIMLVVRVAVAHSVPFAYVALSLESKGGGGTLAPTVVRTFLRSKSPRHLKLLEQYLADDVTEVPNLVKDPLGRRWSPWISIPNLVLVSGSIAQLAAFSIAVWVFDYPFM